MSLLILLEWRWESVSNGDAAAAPSVNIKPKTWTNIDIKCRCDSELRCAILYNCFNFTILMAINFIQQKRIIIEIGGKTQ